MQKSDKIYVAGHGGMVGSSIMRALKNEGFQNIVTKTKKELNLLDQQKVNAFFKKEQPDYVFLCAAKVGGIMANKNQKADFFYENIMIQTNVIHAAHLVKVKKLLFLGSSCIYPKFATQPIAERALMTGTLEPTNDAYAVAKIAGVQMCKAYQEQYGDSFISVMPTNLYGPNDNYDPINSHVLPALIRKMHEAKLNHDSEVEIWGTGSPRREFLFVDDLAEACLFLMENYNKSEHINVGSGFDIPIKELAQLIKLVVGFQGELKFNSNYPDGTPRKLLDCSEIHQLGWKSATPLREGIEKTYQNFLEKVAPNITTIME